MKIKKLILRNIASIEAADIDFENDLNDPYTGQPASIFLIAGDTGAGKSVILDGISMALYKTTPRIKGVVNLTNNNFTNLEGQAVSVNSIEQYTRLGIAPKEPSYSELIFEGNDGRTYHARLNLGVYRGNREANGHRPIKYNDPKWEYQVDQEDWQTIKARGENPLLAAVGLTFEQFGRMAMLAQGQFAAFLTGNKTEREAILEQLTNTSIFSAYGAAISNLAGRSKGEMMAAQTAFETESGHLLSSEKLFELRAQRQVWDTQRTLLQQEQQTVAETQKQLHTVWNYREERAQKEAEQQALNLTIASEAYAQKQQLVADWEASNDARFHFVQRQTAQRKRSNTEQEWPQIQGRFEQLVADGQDRAARLQQQEAELAAWQQWLNERSEKKSLYEKAQTIVEQIRQLSEKQEERAKENQILARALSQVEVLNQKWEIARQAHEAALQKLEAQQAKIHQLQQQRDALAPDQTNLLLNQAQEEKATFEHLQTKLTHLADQKQQLAHTHQTLLENRMALEKLATLEAEKKDAADAAKAVAEKENELLFTMERSLDDQLKVLRHRLHQEHTEHCPLCGQKIEHLGQETDFEDLLKPLRERSAEAKAASHMAEQDFQTAKGQCDQTRGAIVSQEKQTKMLQAAYDLLLKEVATMAQQCGFPSTDALTVVLPAAIQTTQERILQLTQSQQAAEKLLKEINQLAAEKLPMEQEVEQTKDRTSRAQEAIRLNDNRQVEAQQRISEFTAYLSQKEAALDVELGVHFPKWNTDLEVTQQQLVQEAAQYEGQKKAVEKMSHTLENEKGLLEELRASKAEIEQMLPHPLSVVAPKAHPLKDIKTLWKTLHAEVRSVLQTLKDATEEEQQHTARLAAFYATSSLNESSLAALLQAGTEQRVKTAREDITHTRNRLQQAEASISERTVQIAALLEGLGVSTFEELPVGEDLSQRLNELQADLEALTRQIGGIDQQLVAHQENVERVKDRETALSLATAKFGKWERLNKIFGGTRFRNLVQTHILRPLLENANLYLSRITDRYILTCSPDNDQLSILVLDRYHKDQVRSVTVLSGGERFMISLALSLSLSSLNRPDMNVNMLFIDEGFGTLDEKSLDSVMSTLEKLQEIAGESNRRVGIISHREELDERIPTQIRVVKRGEGRSRVMVNT